MAVIPKVRFALCAASQLPGEGPTDVEDAPAIEETDENGWWVDTHHFSGSMLKPSSNMMVTYWKNTKYLRQQNLAILK